ncbi:CrcB family protein [Galactobacter valiniphilus]|uniref:CrcB family protein n=1 Tax=Galactobacter valiniphilus TaxID=2676122 RepID=UPI001313E40D|nr:CrcB family protein [Galactobacter valiniphilus]
MAAGGFLGALARYLSTAGLSASGAELATAAINVAGALALGLLTGLWSRGRGPGSRRDWVRAGLGPGVLGGFTTFSAIAVAFADPFRPWVALAQALLGVCAALLGLWLGGRVPSRERGAA